MSKLFKPIAGDQTLIFLHIPKAAGTTLNSIIDRHFGGKSGAIFAMNGSRNRECEFMLKPEAERIAYRLIRGHMEFGIHRYLPKKSAYITLLRNPVNRIVSFYYYAYSDSRHYLHQHAKRMDLKEFVLSDLSTELENGQTRLLGGDIDLYLRDNSLPCTFADLERAKKNLYEHFFLVGISERFDEFLVFLYQLSEIRNILHVRQNVTINKPRQVDPEIADLILERNQMDWQLYQFVQAIFDDRVKQADTEFLRTLKWFYILNHLYFLSKVYKIKTFVRPAISKLKQLQRKLVK